MFLPNTQPSFLALPTYTQPQLSLSNPASASSSKTLHLPSRTTPTKKRKLNPNGKIKARTKSGVNDSRELDEHDDVDEADLVSGVPGAEQGVLRGIDEDYDEAEEGEGGPVEPADEVEEDTEQGGTAAETNGTTRQTAAARGGKVGKKAVAATMGIDVQAVIARGKAMKGDQM
jgi:transcription initiation factor TFIID subunit 11